MNPERTIYVDGGYNNFTKPDAYASVVNGYGVDILNSVPELVNDMKIKEVLLPIGRRHIAIANFNDVSIQQNNGAELIAAVIGLRLAIYFNSIGINVENVCSDSQLIADYWSNKISKTATDINKIKYIKELIKLKKEFTGRLVKIPGDKNPADLGFH